MNLETRKLFLGIAYCVLAIYFQDKLNVNKKDFDYYLQVVLQMLIFVYGANMAYKSIKEKKENDEKK